MSGRKPEFNNNGDTTGGGGGGGGSASIAGNNTFTGTNEFDSSFSLNGVITPTQITADQNNYSPTGDATANVVRLSADADGHAITGWANGSKGKIQILLNVGSYTFLFPHASTSSTAANRFYNHRSTTITFAPGDMLVKRWDTTLNGWTLNTYGDTPSLTSVTLLGSYPVSPATGDFGYDTTTKQLRAATPIGDGAIVRNWNVNTASSSAINTTASKTDFNVTTTIPAGTLTVGMKIAYKKAYVYSTTGTPTIEMFETIGAATAFVDTGAVTTGLNIASGVILLDVVGQVLTVGASGTIDWQARITIWGALGTVTKDDGYSVTTTVDTTGALILKSSVQWGTSSASNTIIQKPYEVMT